MTAPINPTNDGGYWIDIAGAARIAVEKDGAWRITNAEGGQIAVSFAMRPREEIRVLRLIEYVGTPEWVASTLASPGALIPSGTGQWGGRITSAVVPSELLTQAAAQAAAYRASSPSYELRDQIEQLQAARDALVRGIKLLGVEADMPADTQELLR